MIPRPRLEVGAAWEVEMGWQLGVGPDGLNEPLQDGVPVSYYRSRSLTRPIEPDYAGLR